MSLQGCKIHNIGQRFCVGNGSVIQGFKVFTQGGFVSQKRQRLRGMVSEWRQDEICKRETNTSLRSTTATGLILIVLGGGSVHSNESARIIWNE
jgi:hypothetical protein